MKKWEKINVMETAQENGGGDWQGEMWKFKPFKSIECVKYTPIFKW